MIRLALYSALSDRAALERVVVIDSYTWSEPKTKDAVSALEALGLSGKVLVVLSREDGVAFRSFRNLSNVKSIDPAGSTPTTSLPDWLLFTEATLPTRRPLMRDAMSVLIRPVVSEKTYTLMDQNVYTFIVDPRATKIDVRNAVQQAFNVTVTKVNTLNRKGKSTRNRRTGVVGHRPDSKRAIVTLEVG